jgi:hypothetical protein
MHVTVPRVLGFLLFLALIGYAFLIGPRLDTLSFRPIGSVGPGGLAPLVYAAPHTPVHVPLTRSE